MDRVANLKRGNNCLHGCFANCRWLFVVLLLVVSNLCGAQSLSVQTIRSGLGVPWAMSFLNEREMILTERSGRVGIVDVTGKGVRWLTGVPAVYAKGQGGMMDVAVPKNFKAGDWIYFTYSKPVGDGGTTTLARAHLQNNHLTDWQDLLVTQPVSDVGRHFGSRIAFDGNGHIFVSAGERGHRPNGQNLMTHAGSILRLNLDGSVPADNPFAGRADALPEIWSYGHRNPQGLCFDSIRGGLWASEHGPRGGDEINWILPGANYGWPVVSYGKEYWGPVAVGEATEKAGVESPRKVYIPSIAPGSLLCYSGAAFPEWRGALLLGALKLTHLNVVSLDADAKVLSEQRLLSELNERIRALAQGPGGEIYASTDSGKLLRIAPKK